MAQVLLLLCWCLGKGDAEESEESMQSVISTVKCPTLVGEMSFCIFI